jgi:cytochrome c5
MLQVRAITLQAAVVLILAFAGCGGKEKAADAAEAVREKPASTAAPDEAEAETAALAGAPGKALLDARCAVCHNLERVYKKKLDRAGWEKIVAGMIKKGALLNDAEKEALVTHLAENYGK